METYDNAFELLTDDPVKLKDYKSRSDLIDEINDYVNSKKWGDNQACVNLRIFSWDYAAIKKGEINSLSLSLLTKVGNAIGEIEL